MKNIKGKKGQFLIPILIIIGVIYLILFLITLITTLRTESFYNNNCPDKRLNVNSPIFDDGKHSITCFNDKQNNLIKRSVGFGRALVSPLNLVFGNTCAAGFGSKEFKEDVRCSIVPLWVNLP